MCLSSCTTLLNQVCGHPTTMTGCTDLTAYSIDYSYRDEEVIHQHDLKILKTIPNEILVEREQKCQNCVYAHAATVVKKMKVTDKNVQPCSKQQMLLYGYCPKHESADMLEIQATAEGIM